jgi:hypothetical protein
MPGPITQLLALADLEPTPDVPARRTPRRRLAPATLLAWRIGLTVGTAWTLAVAVLAYLVRF